MEYDPIKHSLGNIFNKNPFLRKVFYLFLDLLLLRAWHVHKEIRSISPVLSRGAGVNILDAGSGFGQYSYRLANKFPEAKILAVDVKEEQISDCTDFFHGTGKKNVRFETADLTTFVRENEFDFALSVDVMEHIREDIQVFKNIYSSLKKGGMLLISTPSDQGGSDVYENNKSSFIGEHVRDGYKIKEIEEKLRTAGFSKVETKYAYGIPGKISWRLSMKYPLMLLNISKIFFLLIPFYYLATYPLSFILNYFDLHCTHKSGTGLIVKAWK